MTTDLSSGPVIPVERSDNPAPRGITIGHVHLRSSDLDRVHDFYVGILGFDVIFRMKDALFLSTDGYHHDLAFNTWHSKGGPPAPPTAAGLFHVAIRYARREDLADALRRLIAADYPIDGASDHGTHEAIYLSDPDGNGLELCWDRAPELWPLDSESHADFVTGRLDLEALLALT
jgi:catechol 2,3-dioxygenase